MMSVYFGNKHSEPMLWWVVVTPPVEAMMSIGMLLVLL
jgi:hypothetical protein